MTKSDLLYLYRAEIDQLFTGDDFELEPDDLICGEVTLYIMGKYEDHASEEEIQDACATFIHRSWFEFEEYAHELVSESYRYRQDMDALESSWRSTRI